MVHYIREDWKAFAEGLMGENKSKVMEEHLLECGLCLERYLSLFPRESTASAAEGLSPQFTSNVMKRIGDIQRQRRGNRHKQGDIFYYAAAACLTILFMSAGVFDGFVHMIPEITQAKIQIERPFEAENGGIIEFGWSDKLMNSTLTFVDSIKPKGEEVPD